MLHFELDRFHDVARLPLNDEYLTQLEPLIHVLGRLYEIARTGGTEEGWQKQVHRCNQAFATATLCGLKGESGICIIMSWAALRDAGIV